LLMRDTATEETVKLTPPTEPECLAHSTCGEFQTASADGSRVFFDTAWETGQLDVFELTSRPGEPLAGKATELTEGKGIHGLVLGASEEGCDVVSEGECDVYFVSGGVLAGSGATTPGNNLYVDRYNAAAKQWEPRFITTLSSGDYPDWDAAGSQGWEQALLQYQPARVSPNGQWLTFMSEARLTGYDNRDANDPGQADAEVYLYHAGAAGTPTLPCVSCGPTGARPFGVEDNSIGLVGATFRSWGTGTGWVAANLPGWRFKIEKEIIKKKERNKITRILKNCKMKKKINSI